MDGTLSRTVAGLKTWDAIATFETNALRLGRLDQELVQALKARSTEMARALLQTKTEIDLIDLSPAEGEIVNVVSEYFGIQKRKGKNIEYTLRQIRRRGLLGAVEAAVSRASPTKGFENLVDEGLNDLSYESIVVRFPEEFTPRAIWFSRRALGLDVQDASPPASVDGDVQSHTMALIQWLRNRAIENEGTIPRFSNQDVADLLGFTDTRSYGRVQGNIQSRLDFACFRAGVPPLGLAADRPFEKAWGNERGRSWEYPVPAMQAAAQRRRWSTEDFDAIMRQSLHLPGQSGSVWRDAELSEDERLRAWAFGFPPVTDENSPRKVDNVKPAGRNADWTRDELILALELYLSARPGVPAKESAEIAELSKTLNRIGRALGSAHSATYRNENSVYMKLMNFRRLDPQYTSEGKVGLPRGNSDEGAVWAEYSNDPEKLKSVSLAIRRAANRLESTTEAIGPGEPDVEEAPEGKILTAVHRYRERDRRLVESKKKKVLKVYGRLECEACGFAFEKVYGPGAAGIIDCHHTKPVHTLEEDAVTRLDDLALLCANCHRMVHSKRPWLTMDALKALLQNGQEAKT